MATIMSWGNSDGAKGRCDGKCHDAEGPNCKCMCGGRYHGSARQPGGVEQAVRDNWVAAIQEAKQKANAEGMKLDTSRLRKLVGLVPAKQGKLPLEAG